MQGVFASTGQCDVALHAPYATTVLCVPLGVRTELEVLLQAHALVVAGALGVVDGLKCLDGDALGVVDPALGVGNAHNGGTELLGLLHGVGRHVAGAVHDHGLALEGVVMALEILVDHIDQAVAGGLGTGKRAAEGEALAGESAGELVAQALVLAKHVGHLAAADPKVTGRHVGVGADVAGELGHEALAEAHDLHV